MTATAITEPRLDQGALDSLFADAHTVHKFSSEPVGPEVVQRAYEDLRWAPTAFNAQPLRLTVLTPGDKRNEVIEHFMEANQQKSLEAPLTVIAAYTEDWHEYMPQLAPQNEGAREKFGSQEKMRKIVGEQSALIQVGYLILALRARGLEVGPMTGLNPAGIDSVVHTENGWKTLVAINVGLPATEGAIRPRGGRLEFEQASQVF